MKVTKTQDGWTKIDLEGYTDQLQLALIFERGLNAHAVAEHARLRRREPNAESKGQHE